MAGMDVLRPVVEEGNSECCLRSRVDEEFVQQTSQFKHNFRGRSGTWSMYMTVQCTSTGFT